MRQPVSPDIERAVETLGLPEVFSRPLIFYVKNLVVRLEPRCVVLYGSLARGTYNTASDIDLVVVSEHLPDGFHERLACLQELNSARRAIDAFGYTGEEFEGMLSRGHVTALDAVADGVPLYGVPYFREVRRIYEDMVRRGLRRSHCSWVLPGPSSTKVS